MPLCKHTLARRLRLPQPRLLILSPQVLSQPIHSPTILSLAPPPLSQPPTRCPPPQWIRCALSPPHLPLPSLPQPLDSQHPQLYHHYRQASVYPSLPPTIRWQPCDSRRPLLARLRQHPTSHLRLRTAAHHRPRPQPHPPPLPPLPTPLPSHSPLHRPHPWPPTGLPLPLS